MQFLIGDGLEGCADHYANNRNYKDCGVSLLLLFLNNLLRRKVSDINLCNTYGEQESFCGSFEGMSHLLLWEDLFG